MLKEVKPLYSTRFWRPLESSISGNCIDIIDLLKSLVCLYPFSNQKGGSLEGIVALLIDDSFIARSSKSSNESS